MASNLSILPEQLKTLDIFLNIMPQGLQQLYVAHAYTQNYTA